MTKNSVLVANDLMNSTARVLASVNDRLVYVGGKYDNNGFFLACHDTSKGKNKQNRMEIWVSEYGQVDVYLGTNLVADMVKASRDYITANRTKWDSKNGFANESKLIFNGENALENAYLFLDSLRFVKSVAKKSATGKKTA